jgi:hypothetical protein
MRTRVPLATTLAVCALALAACGSSSNTPNPATAGASGAAAGSGGAAPDAGGTGVTGAAGTGGALGDDSTSCASYCADITAICKGANAQYRDLANCMKACSYLPAGSSSDAFGNSIGCRHNEAIKAAFEPDPIKPSCWAAGPIGNGLCGDPCDAFCTIALDYCSAAEGYTGTPPYSSLDDCHTRCAQFRVVNDPGVPGSYGPNYTPGPTSDTTDTLQCRAYHLVVNALKSTMFQQIHCPHAAPVSEVCGPGPGPYHPPPDGGDADAPADGSAGAL